MPAADQNPAYVAVVIAILGFMIGVCKRWLWWPGGSAYTYFGAGSAGGVGGWSVIADADGRRCVCGVYVLERVGS